MRRLSLMLCAVAFTVACNFFAPFDPEDQPTRPPGLVVDVDEDGPDGSPDAEPCDRSCGDRRCGPDGCGGTCGDCAEDEVCVACSPLDADCAVPFRCAPPGPGLWVFVHTDTSFALGSPPGEVGREPNESLREVRLTYDFVISSTELDQHLGTNLFFGRNPSHFSESGEGGRCGEDCPVEHLTWSEAALIANALSQAARLEPCYSCADTEGQHHCILVEGLSRPQDCSGYRLPTEAEWEFAARAETTTATFVGDLSEDQTGCDAARPVLDGVAWFCGNAEGITHPVGATRPNAFGLFDMSGNVSEWCHDLYAEAVDELPTLDPSGPAEGTHHVSRGGAWDEPAQHLRSAYRIGVDDRRGFIGLRPLRTVQRNEAPR